MSKYEKIGTIASVAAIMAFSFILVILIKYIDIRSTGTDDFSILDCITGDIGNMSFWGVSISLAFVMLAFYFGPFFLRRMKCLEKDEFKKLEAEYNSKLVHKDDDFNAFAAERNKTKRIDKYKEWIEDRIAKYEFKMSNITAKDLEKGKDKRWKQKIDELKLKMSDEYIKEHPWVRAKSKKTVYQPDVVNPGQYKISIEGKIAQANRDTSKEGILLTRKGVSKLFISVLLSAFGLTPLITWLMTPLFEVDVNSIGFWSSIIVTLISMLFSTFMGILYANNIYNNEHLGVLLYKNTVLDEYIQWSRKEAPKHWSDELRKEFENRAKELNEKEKHIQELNSTLESTLKKAEEVNNNGR